MNKMLGLAIAGSLVAGGIAGSQLASGAGDSAASSFRTVTPCRLVDTRAASKVNRFDAWGPETGRIVDAHGSHGECDIPTRATALSVNVTVVGPTHNSFMVMWPADAATRPLAANINFPGGATPRNNKADIALSSTGQFRMFNKAGTTDVVIDVLGYFEPTVTDTGAVGAVEIFTEELTLALNSDGTGANGQATAACRAGLVAISGGISNELQEALNIRSSRPEPADSLNPTGWFGDVRTADETAAGQTATVYAICIELNN